MNKKVLKKFGHCPNPQATTEKLLFSKIQSQSCLVVWQLTLTDYNFCRIVGELGYNVIDNLHEGMFIPALVGQMSEEQTKKWMPLCLNYCIIGTYAQTEMGHGINTFILLDFILDYSCLQYSGLEQFMLHDWS